MKQGKYFEDVTVSMNSKVPKLYKLNYFGIIKVNFVSDLFIVLINFKNNNDIDTTWNKISSVIAAEISPYFMTEFSKWNLYLFFLCPEKISREVQYEIENNRFSSRKIVIDEYTKKIDTNEIENIISQYVTNDDIEIAEGIVKRQSPQKGFKKTKYLENLVNSKLFEKNGKVLEQEVEKILSILDKNLQADEI